ncbi:MAG: Hsp20/alpha crystallin family protein [Betaproteobacteria bacterium]|jgi:HSP20 family protein|nr:Hsp20/alpha crystallin family protein [Betaproteobacteria bacterium]
MAEINFAESLLRPWLRDFPRLWMSPFPSGFQSAAEAVKVDIREQPEMFLLEAELPGVKKETLKVSVAGSRVTLEGDIRNGTGLPKEERLICGERHVGHVERTLDLDAALDPSRSTAHFEDGLLTVLLYKQSGFEASQIAVN